MNFQEKLHRLEEASEQNIDEDGRPIGVVRVSPGFMLEIVAALRSPSAHREGG